MPVVPVQLEAVDVDFFPDLPAMKTLVSRQNDISSSNRTHIVRHPTHFTERAAQQHRNTRQHFDERE
jgi:hypothetical protein